MVAIVPEVVLDISVLPLAFGKRCIHIRHYIIVNGMEDKDRCFRCPRVGQDRVERQRLVEFGYLVTCSIHADRGHQFVGNMRVNQFIELSGGVFLGVNPLI